MAEGWLHFLAADRYEAISAGTHPVAVHPLAIDAMREVGVDISAQESKSVDNFSGKPIEYLITICDRAKESCPYIPTLLQVFSWTVEDPADVQGTVEQRLTAFRRVRNELRERIENEFLCLCQQDED